MMQNTIMFSILAVIATVIVCFIVIYIIGLSKTEKNLVKSFIKKH